MKTFKLLLILFLITSPLYAADTKITDLTADASPSTDDLLTTINDPGGTPANRKVTIANMESVMESTMDLQDMQGAVTDAQVPNTITIDSASAVESTDLGTLTDGKACTYDLTGTEIDCATDYQPLESTLTDIADGTIAENLVNTANPWADNEVADAITVTPPGATTQVIFNDAGAFAGDAGMTYDKVGNTLNLAGGLTVGPTGGFIISDDGSFSNFVSTTTLIFYGETGLSFESGTGSVDFLSTINFTETGTINGLDAIDATTETTLEAALEATYEPKEYWWPASATLPLQASADSVAPISKNAMTSQDELVVLFDSSNPECRAVNFKVPSDVDTSGTVAFRVDWKSDMTAVGNVLWQANMTQGANENVSNDTSIVIPANADAVQALIGRPTVTDWTASVSTLGWTASEDVNGTICRDANQAGDTMSQDALMVGFGIQIPRS